MNSLINDDSSDECVETPISTKRELIKSKPYISILFKKSGVEKLKSGTDIFEIPLSDLRDSLEPSVKFETIGDLIYFLNKCQYIKNVIDTQFLTTHQNCENDEYEECEGHENEQHNPDCVYYNNNASTFFD